MSGNTQELARLAMYQVSALQGRIIDEIWGGEGLLPVEEHIAPRDVRRHMAVSEESMRLKLI